MTAEGYSLTATVILIFPMLYFLIATLTFFLAKFDDPVITRMLRGLFKTYFTAVPICCGIGIVAFALVGRSAVILGLCLIGALAVAARRWFLHHLDAEFRARDAGDADALRRVRHLHLGGMLYNALQFTVVILSIPFVFRPL